LRSALASSSDRSTTHRCSLSPTTGRRWTTRSWQSSQRVGHPQADVRGASSLRVGTGRWAIRDL